MPARECDTARVRAQRAQPLEVGGEAARSVERVLGARDHQHARPGALGARIELGRHVAADREHGGGGSRAAERGAVGHRDALREPGEHQEAWLAERARQIRERRVDVRDVVGDRVLAILARHPVRDHLVGPRVIEGVERLDRGDQPGLGMGQVREGVEEHARVLGVAVERQVPQSGVLGAPACGPRSVPCAGVAAPSRRAGLSSCRWRRR